MRIEDFSQIFISFIVGAISAGLAFAIIDAKFLKDKPFWLKFIIALLAVAVVSFAIGLIRGLIMN